MDNPDFEWLMIDASHIKAHPHAAGAKGGNKDMGKTKGGLNSKIHLAVGAHGIRVGVIVTSGITADCTKASYLIEGIQAQYLLADRGYDSDAIVDPTRQQGMGRCCYTLCKKGFFLSCYCSNQVSHHVG